MDKYKELRNKALKVAAEIKGMSPDAAACHCNINGLTCRIVSLDGKACMVTADVRMDRIGFVVEHNKVVGVQLG